MKENETPEKIYLFENPITETPYDRWLSKRSDENNIEYTRTDAFIGKAATWINDNANNYWGTEFVESGEMAEDFRKYMKGE